MSQCNSLQGNVHVGFFSNYYLFININLDLNNLKNYWNLVNFNWTEKNSHIYLGYISLECMECKGISIHLISIFLGF